VSELRWATPTRADDAEWASLLAAMEVEDRRGETYSPEDLDDEWASVWAHPDTDAVFVWDGRELVAFAWLKAMPGTREAHRVMCWGGVRPSHRGRGIGAAVYEWILPQATRISAGFDPALPVSLQVDATQHSPDAVALARRFGFEPVRHFAELARPTSVPVPAAPVPAGLELSPWSPDIDEAVRLVHVEAFADHFGSEPRTPEEWKQWYTGHRSFRPDLSCVARHEATGAVVGLVLCAAYPQDWDVVPVETWINTVGTAAAWRGKGVARWLLTEALQRIAAAPDGFERAILGVDEENPTGAYHLYRSLGFSVDARRLTLLARGPLPSAAG
jgi:mycothiol synthase